MAALVQGTVQLDRFSWNRRLARHVKAGQYEKTMELYQLMQQEGLMPDKYTFVPVLNACASLQSLDAGRHAHEQIIQSCCESDLIVGNSLVNMYAKCGSMEDAGRVFNKMPSRDVVSWNAMILGHVRYGQGQKALELFQQMQQEGVLPGRVTFVGVLNACASVVALEEGRRAHQQIIQNSLESDLIVGTTLIDMYAKCTSMQDAWRVFIKMPSRDVVSWNAIILGYVKCGQGKKALELFRQMQCESVVPSPVTFMGVLNACASVVSLEEGRYAHEQILKTGCESNVFVQSSLIDMYAKCGSMEDAGRVFNKMVLHDVVSWNAMILGHVKCGQGQKALELFNCMQQEGVQPDPVTFVGVLNACASILALDEGRHVHEQIIECGLESNIFVQTSLVDMYAKSGSMEDAWNVFDNMGSRVVASWNAMILGLVKCRKGQKVLELFQQMQSEGVQPDPVTFVGVLNACASIGALDEGRRVHEQIIHSGCESDVFVSSSLVDMYAKCGSMKDSWSVFNKMPLRNVVTWNAIIFGYVKFGQGHKALELFQQMQREGVQPGPVTFAGVLNACASIVALEKGRDVHEQVIRSGCESNAFVGTSLVDMYVKCGSMEDASRVFNKLPSLNVVSWTAMLKGYAIHGHGKEALGHFERMCEEGVEVNGVTFVCLLSACSHVGLVDEGLHFFESMGSVYSIAAAVEHYSCMVDLLGRAGHLQKAEDITKVMSCEQSIVVWKALVGACRIHGDVELGERISELVLKADPGNAASYVMLSNIFAAAGKWDLSEAVQHQRKTGV
jgi:pentatricopeptide repeat protein